CMSLATVPELEQIDGASYKRVVDLTFDATGIRLGDGKQRMVSGRLRRLVQEAGLTSYSAYLDHAQQTPAERSKLLDSLTTNETYFFRERYQLDAFRDEVLPGLVERRRDERRLTLWSAGCSTGEEVYTLAMLLRASGLVDGWEVRVFGSDISRRVLQHARRGVYGEAAFRALPAAHRGDFVESSEGRSVRPEIRALCHFGHLNLLEHRRTAIVGKVDAVFCRNVLIYFDEASRAKVLRTFWERLHRGGYLMLGHSESLLQSATDFEFVHLSQDLVYRRPEASPTEAPPAGEDR
ncbi:MAG: protein-glutamate O-methyltransferase CheR, partial [Myxococcota bacterium]